MYKTFSGLIVPDLLWSVILLLVRVLQSTKSNQILLDQLFSLSWWCAHKPVVDIIVSFRSNFLPCQHMLNAPFRLVISSYMTHTKRGAVCPWYIPYCLFVLGLELELSLGQFSYILCSQWEFLLTWCLSLYLCLFAYVILFSFRVRYCLRYCNNHTFHVANKSCVRLSY